MNKKSVYLFNGIADLYSDLSGNFFYKNKPIKKHWRPGQIYLQIDKKKYGMNTLRKLAIISEIETDKIPF